MLFRSACDPECEWSVRLEHEASPAEYGREPAPERYRLDRGTCLPAARTGEGAMRRGPLERLAQDETLPLQRRARSTSALHLESPNNNVEFHPF